MLQQGYGNNLFRRFGYINGELEPTGYWDTIGPDPSPSLYLRLEFPNWGTAANNGTLQSTTIYAGTATSWPDLPSVTQRFSFDSLNRLASASEDSDWSQSYNYDQYGNMWMPSSTLPAPALGPVAPTTNVYSASNNRNVYSSYDASGNLAAFGAIGLSYDAENRQTAAGVNSYLYDGAGRRVSKTTGSGQTAFVYDAFGQLAAEYAGGTVWTKDYIRHGGQIVAIENASGSPCTTCYLSLDLLGGVRMVTDQSANVIARHDYAPFGQEIQSGVGPRTSLWGASDNVNQKFTGQERDGETNLDFFQARYLSSGIGRFNSPDPGNAGADLTNPQSWNGYAYVLNNPLTMIDPSGLDPFSPGDPGDPGDGCDDDDWCGGFPWPTGPGGPVTPPPPPPRQAESGGGNALPRGSFPGGETLGLPPGIGVPSTLQALLGGGSGRPCDFGACGSSILPGAPVALGGLGTLGGGSIVLDLGLGGLCVGTGVCEVIAAGAAVAGVGAGAYIIYNHIRSSAPPVVYMSKGGKGNVAHDYVRDLARTAGGDYCAALKQIVEKAKRSGDTKLFNDAKATYKQDCRGY